MPSPQYGIDNETFRMNMQVVECRSRRCFIASPVKLANTEVAKTRNNTHTTPQVQPNRLSTNRDACSHTEYSI